MNATFDTINQLLHQNQFLSGGLVLGIIGGMIAYLRSVPVKFFNWLWRRIVVTVDVTSDDPIFEWLNIWLDQQPYAARARRLTALSRRTKWGGIDFVEDDESEREEGRLSGGNDTSALQQTRVVFTPATGNHFFFYKRRPVWLLRERKDLTTVGDSSHQKLSKETIHINVLGRSQTLVRRLIEDAGALVMRESKERKTISVKIAEHGHWQKLAEIKPRPLQSVVLPLGLAEKVSADLDEFLESRQWYRDRGIPYRRGYLFYGLAGTGKTSLISALAGEKKMDIHVLTLSGERMTDEYLSSLMLNVGERSCVLLEDVDAIFRGRSRDKAVEGGVTFSGLLNALDGAASKEGVIVFMTTNHVERLDAALIRSGRVDVKVEFTHATTDQAERLFLNFYQSEDTALAHIFAEKALRYEVSMADIQEHLLKYKNEPQSAVEFAEELKKIEHTEEQF